MDKALRLKPGQHLRLMGQIFQAKFCQTYASGWLFWIG